jgi:hypothetical protein
MGIVTAWGSPEYVGKVNFLIAKIQKNPVGQIVLGAIVRQVYVHPVEYHYNRASKTWEHADSCQAIASAHDRDAANLVLKKPGEPGYDERRDKYYLGNAFNRFGTHKDRTPTGMGSSSAVFFTPGEGGKCTDHHGKPSVIDLDATLFHELVHSLRMSLGIISAVPTRTNQFVNEEEFLAIEMTNVYLSARDGKRAKLNHSHVAGDPGDPEWDDHATFVDEPDNDFVLRQHKGWSVFKELAKMKSIPFNPFYEFDQREKAAAAKKRAATAGRR